MSSRELRGLEPVNIAESRLCPKKQSTIMAQLPKILEETHSYSSVMQMASGDSYTLSVEELHAELKHLRGMVCTKTDEITELKVTADMVMNALAEVKVQMETTTQRAVQSQGCYTGSATRARGGEEASSERISTLEIKLEEQQRLNERKQMRTLQEHQAMLEMMKSERNRDVERMEAWLEDVQKSHRLETAQLMEKISMLRGNTQLVSFLHESLTLRLSPCKVQWLLQAATLQQVSL